MSAGEHEDTHVDDDEEYFEARHPSMMLAGYYDDARDPGEYTIQSRDVANFTAWITATDLETVVDVEAMR